MQTLVLWFDRYTDWIERFIVAQHVLAPLLILFVEEAGIPLFIPGDAVLAYTGYTISKTHSTPLWLATMVALIAIVGGSSILFVASRRWGRQLVSKLGRFIFLKQSRIERGERLYKKYGIWTIIFARHIPGMRILVTLLAGTSGIKYRTFILSTIVSTLLWVLFYLSAGRRYGSNIQQLFRQSAGVTVAVFVVVVLVVVGLHVFGVSRRSTTTRK